MDRLLQDLKIALRTLANKPGFSAIAIITLALGIGANTTIFTLLYNVLLDRLPYREPDRLVMVWERHLKRNRERNVVSPGNFLAWKERSQSFEKMASFSHYAMNVTGNGDPERVPALGVSEDFFSTLGIRALQGRTFSKAEWIDTNTEGILLSHEFWMRRMGGEPNLIGRSISVNGRARNVIGILPPGFEIAGYADLITPIVFDEEDRNARGRWLSVVAKLADTASLQTAQSEMNLIAHNLSLERPDFNAGWDVNIVPLHEQLVGGFRKPLWILMGGVAFVLMIACTNVANLLLARGLERRKEFAIRISLGASRNRLIRQLLTEGLVLSLLGAGVGLLFAFWSLESIRAIIPIELPSFVQLRLNPQVLGFTLALSFTTTLLFGLVPALDAAHTNANSGLKEGNVSPGTRRSKIRNILVISEVSISLVLIMGAGLLIKSFYHLQSVDPGMRTENLLTASLSLPSSRYGEDHQILDFYRQLLDHIRQVPEVISAGGISFLPLDGPGAATSYYVMDRPEPPAEDRQVADVRSVDPGFLQAAGIPLLSGRNFSDRDTADSPRVVIINETMAKQWWPETNPVGKKIAMSWDGYLYAEIIGVAGDVKLAGLDVTPRATMYWSYAQLPWNFMTLLIRSANDPIMMADAVRSQIKTLDPELPLYKIRTMEDVVSTSIAKPRFTTLLLGIFAAIALVLGSAGIYGVISHLASQRIREMGIRMALGARRSDIGRLIIRQGFSLTLVGLLIGILATLLLTPVLSELLFEVDPQDTSIFLTACLTVIFVAFLACLTPARRAARTNPVDALRNE